jgi:hypothetical protein
MTAKPRAHLEQKYAYLANRRLVPDAEAFIERAASESSISGKQYQVRCGNDPAVSSRQWLSTELKHWRATHGAPDKYETTFLKDDIVC